MKLRALYSLVPLLSLPWSAQAAEGLSAPSAETLWPQWQARMTLQTTSVSRPNLWAVLDRARQPQAAQGGALLGDYYFAQPALGHFRASGGLMFGVLGGAPSLAASGNRWGLLVQSLGSAPTAATDSVGTVPYLGLGFTSAAWRNAWYLTADVGWVAEQPSALGGFSRALHGSLAWDQALRDMRLAPVVQLGVRLSF
jgi:hypothetical protein